MAAAAISLGVGFTLARLVAIEPNGYVAGFTWFILLVLIAILMGILMILSAVFLLIPRPTKWIGILLVSCAALLPISYISSFALMQRIGWTNIVDDPLRPLPPEVIDLVIIFKPGTDPQQIVQFMSETISTPSSNGGHSPLPGIRDIGRLAPVRGNKAVMIQFLSEATTSQRDDIKARIKVSPVVMVVLQNIARKDLENQIEK